MELRERAPYLKRLAFGTISGEAAGLPQHLHLTGSTPERMDVVVTVDEVDTEAQQRALGC